MTQTNRTVHWLSQASKPLLVLAVVVGAGQAILVFRMPAARRIAYSPEPDAAVVWPESTVALDDIDVRIFQKLGVASGHGAETLSGRFRLAGTFVEYGGATDTRKAVLDDRSTGLQTIASENDTIDGIRIVRIQQTSVDVQDSEGRQERIRLSFTGKQGEKDALGPSRTGDRTETALYDSPAAFQVKQVGEASWVFQREVILDYYRELRDEPERLLNIFDSMKPERNATGDIDGYRLIVEGESDFFQAAGLRENDVVRSINRRPLTNRRIAEAVIADFIADRANAFVMEIEREGKKEQFIYQAR